LGIHPYSSAKNSKQKNQIFFYETRNLVQLTRDKKFTSPN